MEKKRKKFSIIEYIKSFKEFIPTWIICVFMFFWILIIPFIIAIVLLVIQTFQRRKIKEKLEEKTNDFNKAKKEYINSAEINQHHKQCSIVKCVIYILAAIFIIFMLLTVIIGVSSDMEEKKSKNNVSEETKKEKKEETKKEEKLEEKDKTSKDKIAIDVIADEKLKEDFINSCSLVDIKYDKIKNMEKEKDWDAGERYSFTYAGMPFRLYSNMDSTVNVIKLREDIDLYKQGYEPYSINDYIIDEEEKVNLQVLCEDLVKNEIQYPDTVKFPIMGWKFERNKNLYTISNDVKFKNGFGVKKTSSFVVEYGDFGEGYVLIFFGIDERIITDKRNSITSDERKPLKNDSENIETTEQTSEDTIILKFGELDKYGKIIDYDGIETFSYFVPNGTYTVKNKVKWCKVNVAKDEYYKNIDGYMENEIVNTVELSQYGQEEIIDVPVGTHIELTINAEIELIPNNQ